MAGLHHRSLKLGARILDLKGSGIRRHNSRSPEGATFSPSKTIAIRETTPRLADSMDVPTGASSYIVAEVYANDTMAVLACDREPHFDSWPLTRGAEGTMKEDLDQDVDPGTGTTNDDDLGPGPGRGHRDDDVGVHRRRLVVP